MPNEPHDQPGWHRAHVRYPSEYTWLVFIASLDLMFTWIVLHRGGREANLVAHGVIERFGLWGLTAFKFGVVFFVICLCEMIGRRHPTRGRLLALIAIALNCVPVGVAGYLLLTR